MSSGVYRIELEPTLNDQIEVEEMQSLKNIQVFVQRCIDVIQFLKYVSFEGDSEKFENMLMFIFKSSQGKNKEKHKRDIDFLKELADTKFKDLVQEGCG